MRKANTNDLFNFARLINELDLKEDLFNAQQGEEDVEKIGFTFIFDILSKATTKDAQNMIYDVLAEPFEITSKEVGELEITTLIENMQECFDFKTIVNFIKRANF